MKSNGLAQEVHTETHMTGHKLRGLVSLRRLLLDVLLKRKIWARATLCKSPVYREQMNEHNGSASDTV